MSRKRKKTEEVKKLEPRKLDQAEKIMIVIGIIVICLGIYSGWVVHRKVQELQQGSDIMHVDATVTTQERDYNKPLTKEERREKERLEANGVTNYSNGYRYKVYYEFEMEGQTYKDYFYSDKVVQPGTKKDIMVIKTFGTYKVVSEDNYGPETFLSYMVCSVAGILVGIFIIFCAFANLAMDNAPIKKMIKEQQMKEQQKAAIKV